LRPDKRIEKLANVTNDIGGEGGEGVNVSKKLQQNPKEKGGRQEETPGRAPTKPKKKGGLNDHVKTAPKKNQL